MILVILVLCKAEYSQDSGEGGPMLARGWQEKLLEGGSI